MQLKQQNVLLLLPLRRLFLLALSHLLGTCLPSLWSPFFLLYAPTLIPISLAKVRLLLTLTLSHLTIWFSEQTARFLFLLAKAALAYLPTALVAAPRPLSPFRQAHHVQVFLLKPAPFCKLFAGTNKSTDYLLLLSDDRSILTT